VSKIGLPLSIWYWTVTTTASNTNLCLSKPCRKVCVDKLPKHFRRPLKVLWHRRARLLNFSSSLDPMLFGVENKFFSSSFLLCYARSAIASLMRRIFRILILRALSFAFRPPRRNIVRLCAPPLKGHAIWTHFGQCTDIAISYFAAAWFIFWEHAPLSLGRVLCFVSFNLKSVLSTVMQHIFKFLGSAMLSFQTIFFFFKAAILFTHLKRGSPFQYVSHILNRDANIDVFLGYPQRKKWALKKTLQPLFRFLLLG
jgi:hypothetical protein